MVLRPACGVLSPIRDNLDSAFVIAREIIVAVLCSKLIYWFIFFKYD